jgi:hypothetical protein
MNLEKNRALTLQIISLIFYSFLIYKIIEIEKNLVSKIEYTNEKLSISFLSLKDKLNIFTTPLEKLSNSNDKLENAILHVDKKIEQIILNQNNVLKSFSKNVDMLDMDNKKLDFLTTTNQFKFVTKLNDFYSTHNNWIHVITGTVITVIVLAACYYILPQAVGHVGNKINNIIYEVTGTIKKLPGTNSSEGVEWVTDLGVKIYTETIHGKSTVTFLDTFKGTKYTTLKDFLLDHQVFLSRIKDMNIDPNALLDPNTIIDGVSVASLVVNESYTLPLQII